MKRKMIVYGIVVIINLEYCTAIVNKKENIIKKGFSNEEDRLTNAKDLYLNTIADDLHFQNQPDNISTDNETDIMTESSTDLNQIKSNVSDTYKSVPDATPVPDTETSDPDTMTGVPGVIVPGSITTVFDTINGPDTVTNVPDSIISTTKRSAHKPKVSLKTIPSTNYS